MTKQNQEKLQALLEDIGIKSEDARVYLFLMEFPRSKISLISQKTNINRTTIYLIINRLIGQKLIVEAFDGWKKYWVAQDPIALQEVLANNQQKLQKNLHLFQQLNSQDSTEVVKYYVSEPIIKKLYNQIISDLQPKQWYYVFGNQGAWLDLDRDFYNDFIKRRNSLDINIRIILSEGEDAFKHQKLQNSVNVKIKIYENINPITTNFVLTPKQLTIHNLDTKEHRAVSIKDESTVSSFKEMFEMIWEAL
jgi:sugar-specific transcriptional regulator TrmB